MLPREQLPVPLFSSFYGSQRMVERKQGAGARIQATLTQTRVITPGQGLAKSPQTSTVWGAGSTPRRPTWALNPWSIQLPASLPQHL